MKQRITTLFAGGVLALALIGIAAAGPFEGGQAAYQRGDYMEAMRLWRPLAEKGNAKAQSAIGDMYYSGQGVPQDYAQAAMWYRKAAQNAKPLADDDTDPFEADRIAPNGPLPKPRHPAPAAGPKQSAPPTNTTGLKTAKAPPSPDTLDMRWPEYESPELPPWPRPLADSQAAIKRGDYAMAIGLLRALADKGNVDAQLKLGDLYYNGRDQGAPQDYKQAVAWYRKAAEQGNAEAQSDLGAMYFEGAGVPQDYKQAEIWFRKAADQGYETAQDRLGSMYENGQGVPKDFVQAHKWFNLAVTQASDATVRDMWLKHRNEVAAKMTPAQIAEAQRLASEWAPK